MKIVWWGVSILGLIYGKILIVFLKNICIYDGLELLETKINVVFQGNKLDQILQVVHQLIICLLMNDLILGLFYFLWRTLSLRMGEYFGCFLFGRQQEGYTFLDILQIFLFPYYMWFDWLGKFGLESQLHLLQIQCHILLVETFVPVDELLYV